MAARYQPRSRCDVKWPQKCNGDKVSMHKLVCARAGPSVILGLADCRVRGALQAKKDFLYFDHSYFDRGWDKKHFRITRGWIHLTSIKKRPDDRMKKFGVVIEPWRKTGSRVVVIPPTEPYQTRIGGDGWTDKTVAALTTITDRPIVVKAEKGNLREFLADAWAVVTWGSVAGVEAALMGVPVFAEPTCPAYPVSAGTIEQIEAPTYAENRHEWACSLAYASWHTDEIGNIEFNDYDYSLRHDLS